MAPTCADLNKMILAQTKVIESLTERFTAVEKSVPPIAIDPDHTLASQLSQLRASHELEVAAMKTDYEAKIHNLELKLNAVIDATSKTTIQCVTGFFEKLDKKIGEAIIKIDIVEVESAKNELKIDNLSNKLKTEPRGSVINTVTDRNVPSVPTISQNKTVTLSSLEARVDRLEDHSRRDNLLFYGFEEESRYENCENKIRDLLARKILYGLTDVNVNNIDIVRAHRLGQYKAGETRPIIVKFQHYCDKELILKQVYKGTLNSENGKFVNEDFSTNTTNERKFLREQMKIARSTLKDTIKNSSVRYKNIHITTVSGTRFVFPGFKVMNNPQGWWKSIINETAVGDTIDDRQDTENSSGGNEEQFEDCNDGEQSPVVPAEDVSAGEAALTDTAEEAKIP